MRVGLILIIIAGFSSCTKNNADVSAGEIEGLSEPKNVASLPTEPDTAQFEYQDLYKLESYIASDKISKEDIDSVDFDCAILIYPNESQIEEMQKADEEDFYTIADDYTWYQGLAIEMIDSIGIRTKTTQARYLRIKGQQKTWDLDLRKKNLPAWNLVFFKTTKPPVVVSSVDLKADQIVDYFELKK